MTKRIAPLAAAALLLTASASAPAQEKIAAKSVELPEVPQRVLAAGMMDFEPINESSGIVASRQREGVFWTHNDSGDEARIFAVNLGGEVVLPEWIKDPAEYEGVKIEAAANVDWEDIAADDDGNLIIGACGNNANRRRDLGVYIVREPDPEHADKVRASRFVEFRYPDQDAFPPEEMNFDCEAVFWARGKIHFLTKHRSDANTKLYRMDAMEPFERNPLTLLDSFEIGGMVTGADATPDGRRLAVLTYGGVWVFEAENDEQGWFDGSVRWAPIYALQCEAICFAKDGERLVVTNEQRQMFLLSVDDLPVVRPAASELQAEGGSAATPMER